ncbi:hypothetical protein OC834_003783 [Tilletia horrida]|uniref:DUF7704 domain-containing protein n=1 Tax=Tilletia horrida TaxID=155126 RepID=A0AAN6JKE7_9BASI|nr:hypothetical protein OC834_003783 [Tilletia horrida]KAK0531904.1 hypothetical protein OC842_003466 [Tilletia horrida]KAK0533509.1 hypothetical protein OC835_002991 [Tilletia horrida]KAK0559537.1 hypothetical protein OC844_004342 [Tilletia horrida]
MSDPFPLPWYVFFGIVEPISVLAGATYALAFQKKYHYELVPPSFVVPKPKLISKVIKAAPSAAALMPALDAPTSMGLSQLGSCYILIMLNSALMLYAFKRYIKDHDALRNVLVYFFIVLGVADWTHIGLTFYGLPGPAVGSKIGLLLRPEGWNSLLFGNIAITFMLFSCRLAWYLAHGRAALSKVKTQ